MNTLLRVPHFYEDLNYSISLSGITRLKDKAYHQRIGGSKDLVQVSNEGIVRKSIYDKKFQVKDAKPKRKKKKIVSVIVEFIKVRKVHQYQVNKKEVRHRILNFINQQKGKKKLYFWTVTFPLNTTEDTAILLLNKWLTRLRKEKLLFNYLWISERQENGTIHYHIAIPHYLDVRKANKFMRASIMYCINDKSIDFTRDQAKNYNGVDIAKNRKTKRITNFATKSGARSLTNYLVKYVTKNTTSFKHLAWHCSRDFSNLITCFRLLECEYLKSQLVLVLNTEKTFENDWIIFNPWKTEPPNIVTEYLQRLNNIALSLYN